MFAPSVSLTTTIASTNFAASRPVVARQPFNFAVEHVARLLRLAWYGCGIVALVCHKRGGCAATAHLQADAQTVADLPDTDRLILCSKISPNSSRRYPGG